MNPGSDRQHTEATERTHRPLRIDILVDGPDIEAEHDITLPFCGSKNQRIIDVPATLASGSVCLWSERFSLRNAQLG